MPMYKVTMVREVTETDFFRRDVEAVNREEAFKAGMRMASIANHACPNDAAALPNSAQCGEWSVDNITEAK